MIQILTEYDDAYDGGLKKHLFYIEEEGPFVGYGEYHNNKYDEPLFTKETCDEIIEYWELDKPDDRYPDTIVTYDPHKDRFIERNLDDPDDYRIYAGDDYYTVDGVLRLYPFGAPNWVWDLRDDY